MITLAKTSTQNYFVFKTEYSTQFIKWVKKLPGAKWHESKKVWTAPVDPAYFGNVRQIEKFCCDATDEVKALIGVA